MTKKEFEADVDNDKIRDLLDLSDSKIYMKILFNKDDILPYIACFESVDILSALNEELISTILGITIGFLEELIFDKSDNKVMLELIPNMSDVDKDQLH